MVKNQLFIAAALFAGVAIGYFVKSDPPPAAEKKASDGGYVAEAGLDDRGLAASNAALRKRVADLEAMLAKRGESAEGKPQEEKLSDEELTARKRGMHGGPGAMVREWREDMEKLAKENPEEYEKRKQFMERWRQRRIEIASAKLDFLEGAVDPSKLTDEQRQVHENYQNLLVRREELEEKMSNPEMSEQDIEEIMHDMHETRREIGRLAQAERDMLIGQTIESLGFSGSDAEGVKEAFNEILSVTESRGGPGGPPPGGGLGGGPGGAPVAAPRAP